MRVVLVVDDKDFGRQRRWKVRQMPFYYFENLMSGRVKDDSLGSHWHIHLGDREFFVDGGYLSVQVKEYARSLEEVLATYWFVEKVMNFLMTVEKVKSLGDVLRVKKVVITSSHRGRDYRRIFAKELAEKVLSGKRSDFAVQLLSVGKDGVVGDIMFRVINVENGKVGVLKEKGRVAYIVGGYVVGDEDLVLEYVSEVI